MAKRTLTLKKEYFTPDGRRIKGFIKVPSTDKAIPLLEEISTLIVLSSKGINKIVFNKSVSKLNQLQEQLPQVNELINQYIGHDVVIQADPFIPNTEHTELLADGDFNPQTAIISLNTLTRLSWEDIKSIEKSCQKSGILKEGERSLSSGSILHTAVHEYGHAIQLALCCKHDPNNILGAYSSGRVAEKLIEKACHKTGVSLDEFKKSLSSAVYKKSGELFSEAVANYVLAPEENNKTSEMLWKLIKSELGKG